MEGKELPNETNDVSSSCVRAASSVIVCSPSSVGRDVQDKSITSDDIEFQCSMSGAITADSSGRPIAELEAYLHSKLFSLHCEQEGCRKSHRVLPRTQREQDFCRGGVGCFRRQRLIWRLHEVSAAYDEPNSRHRDWDPTLLERLPTYRALESRCRQLVGDFSHRKVHLEFRVTCFASR